MPASVSKPFPNIRPRYGRSTVSPRSVCRASRSAAACAISAVSWDGTDKLRTPDYTLFDAMIRYETGPWRFQVNATNLADKRHVTTCLARGDCFFGIGRTVLGSATYRF